MGLFLEKKWPRLILAAWLVIPGMFTFAAAEPFRSVGFLDDAPVSGSCFTAIDPIDCLAEGAAITNKNRGYSFSPLRTGSLRIVILSGVQDAGTALTLLSLMAMEKSPYFNLQNTILLKLRI